MKILIVAATQKEVKPFLESHSWTNNETLYSAAIGGKKITTLVTGLGIHNTIFETTRLFENTSFDRAIQVGIAGAYHKQLNIGETVIVHKDNFGDLGYEEDEKFIPFTKSSFMDENTIPYTEGWLVNPSPHPDLDYRKVTGITVNRVSGTDRTIGQMAHNHNPDIETMEGAAFMFCCLRYNIKFLQVRTISNYVAKRDKAQWDISLAIDNLNQELDKIIRHL